MPLSLAHRIDGACAQPPALRIRLQIPTSRRLACRSTTVTVTEHITLVAPNPATSVERLEAMVDQLWSLQYMAPNVLTSTAGPLTSSHTASPLPSCTHAVHTRFGSDAKMHTFLGHPRVADAKQRMLTDGAIQAMPEFAFQARVANTLEDVFRRTGAWDTGLEWLVIAVDTGPTAEAAQYVALLAQIAAALDPPALQAVHGEATRLDTPHAGTLRALMARFASRKQVETFAALPPVQAMLGNDEAVPVRVLASLVVDVAPAEQTTTSSSSAVRL